MADQQVAGSGWIAKLIEIVALPYYWVTGRKPQTTDKGQGTKHND